MKTLVSFLAIALLVFGFGCGGGDEQPETSGDQPVEEHEMAMPDEQMILEAVAAIGEIPQLVGDTITTASGLRYIDITVGEGAIPTQGQTCVMHYTGWTTDGTKFDSSHDPDREAFTFPLGAGRVIRGWDEGIASMKVGGRRLLIIPGDLAYGPQGRPPRIPSNATLIFDVELLEIRHDSPGR